MLPRLTIYKKWLDTPGASKRGESGRVSALFCGEICVGELVPHFLTEIVMYYNKMRKNFPQCRESIEIIKYRTIPQEGQILNNT